MAYRAEIQIGVIGIGQLGALQKSLNQISNAVDIINAKQIKAGFNIQNINTYNTQLEKAWKNINKAAMGSQEELQAVQNLVQTKNNQIAAQERLNKLIEREMLMQQKIVATANAGFGQQGPEFPSVSGQGRRGPVSPIGGAVNIPGSPAAMRAAAAGRSKMAENLMLGVGFPLLFGGSAGEVLGSLAGSFVGPGFGGQILGGAIGGIFNDFAKAASDLGAALNPATANVETLARALGGTTTAAGAYITKLEELEQTQKALQVATAELERLVGKQGVQALQVFGDDSAKLGQTFTQAMTQMQASVAALINSTGILKALIQTLEYGVLLRQARESTDPRQRTLLQQRDVAAGPGALGGSVAKLVEINNKLVEQQRIINAEKQKQYEAQTKILTAEEKSQKIQESNKKFAQELQSVYTEITNQTQKRVQAEQAAVDRGLSVSKARYETEKASVDLDKSRLERAYEYAKTEKERLNIAVALFNNAVLAATIEYRQQLESIAAAETKLRVELQELSVAQSRIKLKADEARLVALQEKDEQTRLARLAQIDKTTSNYLDTNNQVITEVQRQLAAQQQIGVYQQQAAAAQYQNKILAAQTQLEQKLVSKEIGLSNQQALRLSNALVNNISYTNTLAASMATVAYNAALAANAINRAQQLPATTGTGVPRLAGGQRAFAVGGYVNRPTRALIGEGGQGEYIVPESKAPMFAQNYMAGARGASALKNSDGDVRINIQTGPVMQQGGQNYVTIQDMEAGLRAVASTILSNGRSYGARRFSGVA